MIVDTSALAAIWWDEPCAAELLAVLRSSPATLISAPTLLELYCVIDSRCDPALRRRLDEFLDGADIAVAEFTERQARIARQAYRDYGRGSGHRAGLNFGDCFSYALAADRREPLLFVGQRFIHTDLTPAWLPPA